MQRRISEKRVGEITYVLYRMSKDEIVPTVVQYWWLKRGWTEDAVLKDFQERNPYKDHINPGGDGWYVLKEEGNEFGPVTP